MIWLLMHLQIDDYTGLNKLMLWEKYFYNYSTFSKMENTDGMHYVFCFFHDFWELCKMFWK